MGKRNRVPKEVKSAVLKAAKYYKLATEHGEFVRDYMESIGIDDEGNSGNILDWYIDVVEQGTGDPKSVIDMLNEHLEELQDGT